MEKQERGTSRRERRSTSDLLRTSVGPDGAKGLAEVLKHNTTLSELNLIDNAIGDEGAVAFANMLQLNSTLTTLDLWMTSMTPVGGAALGAALDQNRTLKQLWIEGNSTATARAFGAALPVDREISTPWYNDDEGEVAFNEARKEKKELLSSTYGGPEQRQTTFLHSTQQSREHPRTAREQCDDDAGTP
ncbi:hypothetical protein PTSG_11604 [Salpingoeca rosetta]|uniref:Uncharacterized protein n=1 Tax=Salpingoeca rosetta (strain ATCC 50818 / BSB-021) TaxID=946362 RepID=F2TWR4_SALR5|nr:uncharacterized protein PTSG_11604 [Salpingoeca rosetta]EGD72510.1 hypothetical protein PTSG_11604 [Salpingoeca rosetta]|eukprot:XP_004999079.1 hypothetical protein PTSG_11604 [Salpingoeca rosetta]